MKRLVSSTLTSVIVAGGLVGVTGSPAFAACAPDPVKKYAISKKSTVYRGTNLHSTWMDMRGASEVSVSYNKSSTATASVSGTAGIEAEAGVIFTKASTSFSVTVGGEWSSSKSWNYEMKAKKVKGKNQVRMRLFHEAKRFRVGKSITTNKPNCKGTTTKHSWNKTITAPTKRSSNDFWRLEYRYVK
ncbi:hypothetical protein [Streptomyces adelaidensis]|uniref:hypothetical protein n=1 Tax=Streptomyces adelaidensis TaxID=2796465 RepID=UPI00190458D3|nr:hypothetical protein [Streptomyces adelaidensis]